MVFLQSILSFTIMSKEDILNAMRNRLKSIDPKAQAFLFGSRARGTAHKGSDWDILILLDKPRITLEDYNKYSYPLRELGWDLDEIINPVLFTKEDWKDNNFTPFNHNVNADRIAL